EAPQPGSAARKIYPIVKYGDPILEKPGAAVKQFDAELEELAEDMFASMYAAQGVGLAAPQIGKSLRLAVVDVTGGKNPEAKIVLANPEIIHAEGEVREEEGCLSIPGFRGYVLRPQFVTIKAQNAKGETFEIRGENQLAVYQPEKIRAPETEALLQKLAPDGVVIIAYGQLIPAKLLPIPKLGWINLHASLLPKYRGAAPINWAIGNGETRTGVTTMRIDAGMDTGDMLLQREIEIGAKETAPELAARLSEVGASLMVETLRGLAAGTIAAKAQNHGAASNAPMLEKEDGRIDWKRSAREIYNRMRGFAPWPGAYTTFRGQTCHVWGEPASKGEGARLPSGGN